LTGFGQDPELVQEFMAEANEHLATVEEDILAVERLGGAGNGEVVNHLFRSLHTVKGGANLLGFATLTKLAHALENVVGQIRSGTLAVDRATVDALLKGTDTLKRLVRDPHDVSIDIREEVAAAEAVLAGKGPTPESPSGSVAPKAVDAAPDTAPAPAERPRRPRRKKGTAQTPVADRDKPSSAGLRSVAPADEHLESASDQTVRISLALLDRLMNLASELVLVRNQNMQATESRDLEQLAAIGQRLNVVTSELQTTVMQTRMRPIGSVFTKFSRMVRDLARTLGKEVDLAIVGSEVELDKTIVEAMGDPLTHLVRNAVDHGIEPPGERQQQGKPPVGRLSLRAFHQDGQVFVQVQDDGKGMDPAVLKRVAVERGVLREEEAESLSDREALVLIFRPGFSTASQVTDLSGRGVGMDVVKAALQRLSGTVDLASTVGKGTTITIKLPLTLAIVPTLIVAVGEHYFAIPQINIDEVVWLHGTSGAEAMKRVADHEVYWLRGKLLPVLRLAKVLDLAPADGAAVARPADDAAHVAAEDAVAPPDDVALAREMSSPGTAYIVVLKQGNERFGLVVDKLVDTQEIVVKPLHEELKESRPFSGTTVLGDGRIALILDIASVAELGNLRFIKTEPQVGGTKSSLHDEQTVLLFDIGSDERFFIPLCLITRVEEIRPSQVQVAGEREYLDFRGSLMPLARIERTIPNLRPQYPADRLYVIVPKCRRPFGILAARILDTVQVPQQIDTATVKMRGVSGSQIIHGRMALFLNPLSAIETIEPDWLAEDFSRVSGVQRVLIVDDSPFSQVVLGSYLHGTNVTPTLAANGREALAALARESYDVVISDLEMPVMDGFDLARAIRQQESGRHLPLLAVSAAGEEMGPLALEAGFDEYRSKFDQPRFLEAFLRLCQRADSAPHGR
jgi:two-component system chemotaxis sensor kinase CheA